MSQGQISDITRYMNELGARARAASRALAAAETNAKNGALHAIAVWTPRCWTAWN